MASNWRVARSLMTMLDQVNAAYPGRNKAWDGTIGDAAHAARTSDHNPWVKDGNMGVVRARDITHDPAHGCDAGKIAEAIVNAARAGKDKRARYVIWNRHIAEAANGWAWKAYTGINPHDHHCHISVQITKNLYDDTAPWALPGTDLPVVAAPSIAQQHPTPEAPAPDFAAMPLLRFGEEGNEDFVKEMQRWLGFTGDDVDGNFGAGTLKALKKRQKAAGIGADGVVGPQTWKLIRTPVAA